jgi:hypothetical protein
MLAAHSTPSDVSRMVALRRELELAERAFRNDAEHEARRLVQADRTAWREARDACASYDRVRRGASERLEAIHAGAPERFAGERRLAEMALRDADLADATYTIVSFANRQDRLRYLRGGSERAAVVSETLRRQGVLDDRGHFIEVVR